MQEALQESVRLLGYKVLDIPTGMTGVVDSISFNLSGHISAAIRPTYNEKEGKLPDGIWADVNRLQILSEKPVVQVPAFTNAIPGRQRVAA